MQSLAKSVGNVNQVMRVGGIVGLISFIPENNLRRLGYRTLRR